MNQISRERRQPIDLVVRPAVFDNDVLALDETCFLQTLGGRPELLSEVYAMAMPAEIRMEVIQRELWVESCGFTAAVPETSKHCRVGSNRCGD
jgi:hypothetical protein